MSASISRTRFPVWARERARAKVMLLLPSFGTELVIMMTRMLLPQNWMLVRRVLIASS